MTRAQNRMKSVKISLIGRRETSHDIEETAVQHASTARGIQGRRHEARHFDAKTKTSAMKNAR